VSIDIHTHPKFAGRIDRARLKRIAKKTLRAEKARAALTIYITTDAEIRKLNRQFHATDSATDVLAFSAEPRYGERGYLGDVIISYDTAKRQACDAGWRIADELDLLMVHGILHLLGYDDVTPRKRARMWKRQAEILGRVAGND